MNPNNIEFVKRITLDECSDWILQEELRHITGRYFSVCGIRKLKQEYVLIRQPELGLLASLVTSHQQKHYILIQNKAEPGNLPIYQWAPTVQATLSNYKRVHGGRSTPYLDYFKESKIDVLASEQGDRFLNKFNRNAMRLINDKFEIHFPNYLWIELSEFKNKLRASNKINTDLRSVISSSDWTFMSESHVPIFSNEKLPDRIKSSFQLSYSILDKIKLSNALRNLIKASEKLHEHSEIVPLHSLKSFSIRSEGIYKKEHHSFVQYYHIRLPSREVDEWCQPLFHLSGEQVCALCFIIEDGSAYFFLRLYNDIGFENRFEYGPSLQLSSTDTTVLSSEVTDLLKKERALVEIEQTDEGGRFYQNICRYKVIEVDEAEKNLFEADSGIWLSLSEIQQLSKRSKTITNELRTCISLILSFI